MTIMNFTTFHQQDNVRNYRRIHILKLDDHFVGLSTFTRRQKKISRCLYRKEIYFNFYNVVRTICRNFGKLPSTRIFQNYLHHLSKQSFPNYLRHAVEEILQNSRLCTSSKNHQNYLQLQNFDGVQNYFRLSISQESKSDIIFQNNAQIMVKSLFPNFGRFLCKNLFLDYWQHQNKELRRKSSQKHFRRQLGRRFLPFCRRSGLRADSEHFVRPDHPQPREQHEMRNFKLRALHFPLFQRYSQISRHLRQLA
jgi:hypothetical protein